jgi:hypothetical protein
MWGGCKVTRLVRLFGALFLLCLIGAAANFYLDLGWSGRCDVPALSVAG